MKKPTTLDATSSRIKKELWNRLPAMLLDYVTYTPVPSKLKSIISSHLRLGPDVSGLVEKVEDLYHGFEMVGSCLSIEIWVLPFVIKKHMLYAVWHVDADKYYVQDESPRTRKIVCPQSLP